MLTGVSVLYALMAQPGLVVLTGVSVLFALMAQPGAGSGAMGWSARRGCLASSADDPIHHPPFLASFGVGGVLEVAWPQAPPLAGVGETALDRQGPGGGVLRETREGAHEEEWASFAAGFQQRVRACLEDPGWAGAMPGWDEWDAAEEELQSTLRPPLVAAAVEATTDTEAAQNSSPRKESAAATAAAARFAPGMESALANPAIMQPVIRMACPTGYLSSLFAPKAARREGRLRLRNSGELAAPAHLQAILRFFLRS